MHPRRLRILHVTPSLWSGAGAVITRLCESLAPAASVRLVTAGVHTPTGDWGGYRRRLAAAGVEVATIDFFHRDPATFWTAIERLSDLVRAWRPDVIHTHAGVAACAAAMLDRQTRRVPVVAQLHSWGPGRPVWMNGMDCWGFRRAARSVVGSRAYRNTLREAGVPASRIVYQPWGLTVPDPKCRRPQGDRTSPRVGFLGRIEPRKGQLDLVRALPSIRRVVPGVHLCLLGPVADPDYASRIHREISAGGLGSHVTMPGYVRDAHAEVAGWDAFVSLSSDEGQGLAVLEAMALGVPVVARRVAGIEDYLVNGQTGFELPDGRPGTIARRILAIFANREAASVVANSAARMVRRRYDWNRMVDRFWRLYETVARRDDARGA